MSHNVSVTNAGDRPFFHNVQSQWEGLGSFWGLPQKSWLIAIIVGPDPPLLPQVHYSSLSMTRLGCLPKILIHGIVGGIARDILVGWDATYYPIYSYGKVFPAGEAGLS